MKRQQIIAIVVVLLLAGGAGAGYQFYFRPALEKFTEDKRYLSDLNTKLKTLQTTFQGAKPEAAVTRVKEKIQPWHDTLEQRVRQFTVGDFTRIDELPQTAVLKAYYAKTSQKMVDDLRLELYTKGVYYQPNIDFFFQMVTPNALSNKAVLPDDVEYWLSTIKLGTSITRMLVSSEILGIQNIQLWEPRDSPNGFTSYTVGVSMWMTLDQFCKFLEKLQSDETMCITVHGFRVTNNLLRSYPDPPLRIELLFQIDQYKLQAEPVQAGAPGALPAGTAGALGGNTQIQQIKARREAIASGGAGVKKPTSSSEQPWWRRMLPW